jgi:hypothetical protein
LILERPVQRAKVVPAFHSGQVLLFESRQLDRLQVVRPETGERATTPQRQRLVDRVPLLHALDGLGSSPQQASETQYVDLLGLDAQAVPGRTGRHQLGPQPQPQATAWERCPAMLDHPG